MANSRKSTQPTLNVSSPQDFKARMGGIMELPSGMVVKVKNPGGLQAFIANGSIPNSLLGIVQEGLDGKSREEVTAAAATLAQDMDKLADMMQMMNIIVTQTIIEPEVRAVPTQEDIDRWNILHPRATKLETVEQYQDKHPDIVWIDEITDQDKEFLFQWVNGGVRDLETFRAQHKASMAAVSAGKGAKDSAK